MKKVALGLMVVALVVGIVVTVGSREHLNEERAKKRMERLAKELDLSKEQRDKIELIVKDSRDKIKPLVEQIKQIKEETDENIQKELSEEQVEKWNELKEKMKKKRKQMMKKHIEEIENE